MILLRKAHVFLVKVSRLLNAIKTYTINQTSAYQINQRAFVTITKLMRFPVHIRKLYSRYEITKDINFNVMMYQLTDNSLIKYIPSFKVFKV